MALLAVIATALVAGGWATPAEGASSPGVVPAIAMVTVPAKEGDGSAPAAPADTAAGASSPVEGVSTTLCRWGLGIKDEGLQNRFTTSLQQNNSIPLQFDKYLPDEVGGAGFAFPHLPTPPWD